VHFARNATAYAGKRGQRVVSAFVASAYEQQTPEAIKVHAIEAATALIVVAEG
jgi:hypothetical protein